MSWEGRDFTFDGKPAKTLILIFFAGKKRQPPVSSDEEEEEGEEQDIVRMEFEEYLLEVTKKELEEQPIFSTSFDLCWY